MTGKGKTKEVKDTDVQPEPEVVIKEVEKPLNLAEKSPTELEQLKDQIEAQKVENHLEAEKKKIKALKCPACNTNLKLDPERYMKEGSIKDETECKKCEKLVTVGITYNGDPSILTAQIDGPRAGNFVWEVKKPVDWEDKHVKKWAEEEMSKLKENKSSLSINEQKLFRLLYLGLKKQKIVK
ncbi:hypothetical protein [Methanobacterium ferruginis]|uniref:hypothetical protein n=1 Tax=Methanobacterium ferruginis TaxID=710191 RepID=UPI00257449B9|nr:hypothetical protein [Methanobacterium ferruginis]BDZ68594.1 hypothetical protein GCM10025860_20420 [Methanobacterium ferruginis]